MVQEICIAADSFGEGLKDHIVKKLCEKGVQVHDMGTHPHVDAGAMVAQKVDAPGNDIPEPGALPRIAGIAVCGTGAGVCIAANKAAHKAFAFTCENVAAARNARSINNCNVLCLGAMITPQATADEIVDAWLTQKFKGPAPASGEEEWGDDIKDFLDSTLPAMQELGDRMLNSGAAATA